MNLTGHKNTIKHNSLTFKALLAQKETSVSLIADWGSTVRSLWPHKHSVGLITVRTPKIFAIYRIIWPSTTQCQIITGRRWKMLFVCSPLWVLSTKTNINFPQPPKNWPEVWRREPRKLWFSQQLSPNWDWSNVFVYQCFQPDFFMNKKWLYVHVVKLSPF